MRYFRCEKLKWAERKTVVQYPELTPEEKKSDRLGKRLNVLATVLFFVTLIAVFVGGNFMLVSLPLPENPILLVLIGLGMLVLDFGIFVVAVLIGTLVSSPIYRAAQKRLVIRRGNVFDEALFSLREYYEWQEPCMVTKCFFSSDKKFKNRDVCIFVVGDELRIASNLKYGFSHREADLGCYVFSCDEISVGQIQGERFLMTELTGGETVFHLGRRAKGFIDRNFISKRGDA